MNVQCCPHALPGFEAICLVSYVFYYTETLDGPVHKLWSQPQGVASTDCNSLMVPRRAVGCVHNTPWTVKLHLCVSLQLLSAALHAYQLRCHL